MHKEYFSEWLFKKRKFRGWTQAELARRCGMNRQTISQYENQRRMKPDKDQLYKLANGLELPSNEVLEAAGHVNPEPEKVPGMREWTFYYESVSEETREQMLDNARYKYIRDKGIDTEYPPKSKTPKINREGITPPEVVKE